jgi:starch-binding outer membrane protein, SusD/RagB family
MSRYMKTALVAGLAVAAGCTNFLEGDKLSSDPNRPISASSAQLLTAVQVNGYYIMNGAGARTLVMWSQQMAGTDRQYAGYGVYQGITEGLFGEFSAAYTGGGLIDIRAIEADAKDAGNKTLSGIAKVWEALQISFVADIYGDIPYTEAARSDIATPKLDKQIDVYAALQTLLDGAITDLGGGTAATVGNLELWFHGDPAKWIKVAHTLKARLYLHTAEVDPSAYAKALSEAQLGIAAPSGDLKEYHSDANLEENIWWQFIARDRDSYIRPGKFLVDLMKTRSDPRLPAYFSKGSTGQYIGAAPGGGLPADVSNISDDRLIPSFPQPIVTFVENEAIIAEAAYRTGNTALARTALDALRTNAGETPNASGLSGAALLTGILDEKYIGLFQNYEVFNDYKRTCYPNLTPASNAFSGNIPPRFTYPIAERTANPNIPLPSAQPARNQNDPVTATSADGTACKGQK